MSATPEPRREGEEEEEEEENERAEVRAHAGSAGQVSGQDAGNGGGAGRGGASPEGPPDGASVAAAGSDGKAGEEGKEKEGSARPVAEGKEEDEDGPTASARRRFSGTAAAAAAVAGLWGPPSPATAASASASSAPPSSAPKGRPRPAPVRGASMALDVEQAALNERAAAAAAAAARKGGRGAVPAAGTARILVGDARRRWVLPLRAQLERSVRDGAAKADERIACISRLTGCGRGRVGLSLLVVGIVVASKVAGDVRSIEGLVGLRGGRPDGGEWWRPEPGVGYPPPATAFYDSPPASAQPRASGGWGWGWYGPAVPPPPAAPPPAVPPPPGTALPEVWDSMSDFTDPFRSRPRPLIEGEAGRRRRLEAGGDVAWDVPLFWHVPRSGGETMLQIMGGCVGLVLTSGAGPASGGGDEEVVGPGHLKILSTPDGGAYVNVDTTTPGGLERARELDLLGSGLADVVSTPLPAEAARSLFCGGGTDGPSPYRGRMFVMLRDPATRAWSYFRQASDPASGPGRYDPALRGATLEQYAAWGLDRPEFNWMTKTLAQRPGLTTADLTTADLNLAKEVLRRKAVVGLLEQKADTLLRMEGYFGWQYGAGDGAAEDRACTDRVLHWEWKNKNRNRSAEGGGGAADAAAFDSPLAEGSELYARLRERNSFDADLYEYARQILFPEQGELLRGNAAQRG